MAYRRPFSDFSWGEGGSVHRLNGTKSWYWLAKDWISQKWKVKDRSLFMWGGEGIFFVLAWNVTHPSIRSSCSLKEISISWGPVSYSAATSCWCAFLYCYSMTVIIWFTFAFTFITQNKVIVTVTLITVLTNTDAWRKCRFLWSFIIVYCDSLDFVEVLSFFAVS